MPYGYAGSSSYSAPRVDMAALDLNSTAEEWPSMAEYAGILRSGSQGQLRERSNEQDRDERGHTKVPGSNNLVHDRTQISGRIRTLKQYYTFIKSLRNDTGLGRHSDGTIDASDSWWTENTQGHP
ncbi:hypothetical protein C2845_PM01G38760 [Panicum miliaceum]|uniref:Uncharacterized protein n=1 Tax=Panicum miliaceum TaxID=4540 RepID=A0A3L6TNB1_PANMI|nr:hypothetical protein C2845_PM01G38760 [Panicum miliaceum]